MAYIHRFLSAFIQTTGKYISWLALFLVITEFTVVFTRYVFDWGSLYIQDSVVYMHTLLFLLGAGFTLQHDGHVRVDILYHQMSVYKKSWINIFGIFVFLFPFCFFVIYLSWSYVHQSWQIFEGSADTGGLPLVYILKSSLILFPFLIITQGLAVLCESLMNIFKGQK